MSKEKPKKETINWEKQKFIDNKKFENKIGTGIMRKKNENARRNMNKQKKKHKIIQCLDQQ